MEFLILFIFLALLSEILGTVGGFGSSLFFVPLAGLFFDFHSVLGITALFHIFSNISKLAVFRKGINKRLILNIGIPSVIFAVIGAFLSKYIDNKMLEITYAVFLIIISVSLILYKSLTIKPTFLNSIIGGALSGITTGILGSGGAIRGLTLAAFDLEKQIFITTSSIIDLGLDCSRSVVYFFNGYFHQHDLYLIPILIVVSVLGSYLGKKILSKFSQFQFKYFVLFLILIIGIVMLGKNIWHYVS